MSQRFFTSDFHIGMSKILEYESRPFKNIDEMNVALLHTCCEQSSENDIIYHIGDMFSFGFDRGASGLNMKPQEFFKPIRATLVNIRGNHDSNNHVKSIAESLRLSLNVRFPHVSLSHYPSYDRHAFGHFINGDIHLCGHVHRQWKHCLDLTHNVLNVNVGVDVWNFKLVSDTQLIEYLTRLFKRDPNTLNQCKTLPNGRVAFTQESQTSII